MTGRGCPSVPLHEKGPAIAGPFAFLPLKESGRWDGHSRGKNWGGLGTQVVVDLPPWILPLSGGIANPSEAVPLLCERVGVIVVAVALPEAGAVGRGQLDRA